MKGRLRGRMGGSMTAYKDRSKEELLQEKSQLEAQYKEFQGKGLKLDMSRGKPSAAQLDLSMGMMDVLDSLTVTMVLWMASRKQSVCWEN